MLIGTKNYFYFKLMSTRPTTTTTKHKHSIRYEKHFLKNLGSFAVWYFLTSWFFEFPDFLNSTMQISNSLDKYKKLVIWTELIGGRRQKSKMSLAHVTSI